ncbi:MAG TPA: ketol-acid reductoisomerase [Longimicrobiales bacterium]|nr:ketol-acid reductoisomerase [Longimicrobiales bacterium]
MSTVRVYESSDTDPALLQARRVAIVGYGSQGHAHALNLHDSGVDVVVGLRPDSPTRERVEGDGLATATVADAVASADLVSILIPDAGQRRLYETEVAPNLKDGGALLFAHGFNIHYRQIEPRASVDVIMVAPKAPGAMVRREYEAGCGVPGLIAVHQDSTGQARDVALAYADALGCTRAGVIETTFKDETETDLFGEQAVLCGGVSALIRAGFDTLTGAGYAPELAYFECLHELKLIVDLIQSGGLSGMRAEVSDTAEYGDYVGGPKVIGADSRRAMEELLLEIQSGDFADRWIRDGQCGHPEFGRLRDEARGDPLDTVGRDLRARMAWL